MLLRSSPATVAPPANPPRRGGLRLVPVGYPEWLPSSLVNLLVVGGVGACVLEGFWDVGDPHEVHAVLASSLALQAHLLQQELGVALKVYLAWPLFLWFCALILTLEYYILRRNHARQRWIYAALTFTGVSIVLVVLAHNPTFLSDPIGWVRGYLPGWRPPPPDDQAYAKFWTAVNVGVLTAYVIGAVRRWRLRLGGKPLNPHAGIALEGDSQPSAPGVVPQLRQLKWKDVVSELLAVDILG